MSMLKSWRNILKRLLSTGTKSVLFGAHAFWIHPIFVWLAWIKLFGFPWDPRLYCAFFLHDIGYVFKARMDDAEGELHPYTGALIMKFLFDPGMLWDEGGEWYEFTLLHSRYLSKKLGKPFSKLCLADKLAFCLTPRWLYLPMVRWTGELDEYIEVARTAGAEGGRFKPADYSRDHKKWHAEVHDYIEKWVAAHRDMQPDTWTSEHRHAEVQA